MSDSKMGLLPDEGAWCLNPRVQLHWRHLSGEWLVFEVLSGQTHHLDPVAAAVLTCFETGEALTRQDLTERLDTDYGAALSSTQMEAALSAHAQWAGLGILVPATQGAHLHAAV
jgi:PqqD family protein of HPr-rel-A system